MATITPLDPAKDVAGEEPPAGISAGHSLASFTPYKHAFVVSAAAALEELHPWRTSHVQLDPGQFLNA